MMTGLLVEARRRGKKTWMVRMGEYRLSSKSWRNAGMEMSRMGDFWEVSVEGSLARNGHTYRETATCVQHEAVELPTEEVGDVGESGLEGVF